MSKLLEQPVLPQSPESEYQRRLSVRLYELLRLIAIKVNGLASGKVAALDGGGTAAPTSGEWARGDTWRNTEPAELGIVGSKYIVKGWICTASGTPGTWVAERVLTGN